MIPMKLGKSGGWGESIHRTCHGQVGLASIALSLWRHEEEYDPKKLEMTAM